MQSQSKYLNGLLDRPYTHSQTSVSRIYQSSDGSQQREGLAALSRHPIIDSEVIVLAKRPDDKHTRIIQNISVLIDGKITNFTNVHFSNNQYSIEQLTETLEIIKARNEPGVILGDFNIQDIQAHSNVFASSYTVSTEFTPYISFPSESATFDYVLLPKQYQYISLNVTEGLSDHNALTTELNI